MTNEDQVLGILLVQDNAAKRGAVNLWTIYDRPSDYPYGHIARRHEVVHDQEPIATQHYLIGSLEELRAIFQEAGLVAVCRQEDDEPQVVETWL